MKATTGVGAPSYMSGRYMWKGTAAILKPNPAARSTMAMSRAGLLSPAMLAARATASRLVPPARP